VRVPILAVVNAADEIAPRASVSPFLDAMLAQDVRLIEYPSETGVCLQPRILHLRFFVRFSIIAYSACL
jgi:predicted alpha/beta hydrolase